MIHITASPENNPFRASPDWDSVEGLAEFVPPFTQGEFHGQVPTFDAVADRQIQAEVVSRGHESSIAGSIRLPEEPPLVPSSVWGDSQDAFHSGERRPSVKRFRGKTSPWNVLVDESATASVALAMGTFNETITRLAEEESTTRPRTRHVQYDLIKELPLVTPEIVYEYAKDYAIEAPFPVVCWPNLQQAIDQGLSTHRWTRWGEIVCVLLVR